MLQVCDKEVGLKQIFSVGEWISLTALRKLALTLDGIIARILIL